MINAQNQAIVLLCPIKVLGEGNLLDVLINFLVNEPFYWDIYACKYSRIINRTVGIWVCTKLPIKIPHTVLITDTGEIRITWKVQQESSLVVEIV